MATKDLGKQETHKETSHVRTCSRRVQHPRLPVSWPIGQHRSLSLFLFLSPLCVFFFSLLVSPLALLLSLSLSALC
jgi:hypothetical protein